MEGRKLRIEAEKWLIKRFPAYEHDKSVIPVDIEVFESGAQYGYSQAQSEIAKLKEKFDVCDRDRVLAENERDQALARLKVAEDGIKHQISNIECGYPVLKANLEWILEALAEIRGENEA